MLISEAAKETWQMNDRVNEVLLEHLTPDMLEAQTPGGGYSVAQHLAHMAEAKKFWNAMLNEEQANTSPNLFEEGMIAKTDLVQIKAVFRQTNKVTLEIASNITDLGDFPYTSVDSYLIHLIAHDAHHRGQILLALKTTDYLLPDEGAFWGPWRSE